jgi:TRAP-type C4-dicarboxylate transport system substrate-binding protein
LIPLEERRKAMGRTKIPAVKIVISIMFLVFLASNGVLYVEPAHAAQSAKVFKWKLFEFQTMKDWPFRQHQIFAEKIAKATNGRVQITVFARGEHPIDHGTLLKALSTRQCDLAVFQGCAVAGTEKTYSVYDIPMYFPQDRDFMYKLYAETRKEILQPIEDRWNIRELYTIFFPQQRFHATVPVTSWDSLKGKKIRVKDVNWSRLVSLMGGIPVSIVWGEVSTALGTGLITGAITSSGSAYDGGLYDFVKYQTLFEMGVAHHQLSINKAALAELDEPTRQIVLKVSKEFEPYVREGNYIDSEMTVAKAVLKYGVTVVAPPKKFWLEVQEKNRSEGLWDAWAKDAGAEGVRALKILDAKMKAMGN